MGTKIRKQIYIEIEQEQRLKNLSRQIGLSEAELIRQALDRHTRGIIPIQPNLIAWEEERAFIEQLIAAGPIAGGRSWQREDLYEQ